MEQFDPSEFTAEFCVERFRAGEPAYSTITNDFRLIKDTPLLSEPAENYEAHVNKHWRMRPAQDGWIQHGGEECPIPWAKAGELQVKLRCGEICSSFPAEGHLGYHWPHLNQDGDIIAYRLTDGWIPVKSGECPKLPGSGPWEYKFQNGNVLMSYVDNPEDGKYRWTNTGRAVDIVAVRRVPQVEASVPPPAPAEEIKHQLEGIDADIREILKIPLDGHGHKRLEWIGIDYAEGFCAEPVEKPFNISAIIDNAFAEARDGKKISGPVVECPVIARLMR